jgi:hypothetical protein
MMEQEYETVVPYQERRLPVRRQVTPMQDPFLSDGMPATLPAVPMGDGGTAMLNALLSDDSVPDSMRKNFWFVFHRDNVLTFLDEERKRSKLLNFDIIKIDSLNSTPYYDYSFDQEMQWNSARQILETKLDRALGSGGKNERLTIPLTITEQRQIMEDHTSGQVREGFLKRLLNRR